MSTKKLKFGHYYVIIFVTVFTILVIRGCIIQNQIKTQGKEIVVKYIRKKTQPKTTNFYFGYFYNGKYRETSGSGIKYSILNSEKETELINNLEIGGFYYAKLDNEYPESIIVDPSKKVTDLNVIQHAGFKIEE